MANGCAELYQTFLLQSSETGSVLVHTCHPRTFKAEEGESQAGGQSWQLTVPPQKSLGTNKVPSLDTWLSYYQECYFESFLSKPDLNRSEPSKRQAIFCSPVEGCTPTQPGEHLESESQRVHAPTVSSHHPHPRLPIPVAGIVIKILRHNV